MIVQECVELCGNDVMIWFTQNELIFILMNKLYDILFDTFLYFSMITLIMMF